MPRGRMSTRYWLIGAVVLLLGFGLAVAVLLRQSKDVNVILITVDTLRADHLNPYGYARNTSPNLDQFAKESIVFRQAHSHAPETVPSLSSLMTSHYPRETKVLSNDHRLMPEAVTWAELLHDAGYVTGAIVGSAATASLGIVMNHSAGDFFVGVDREGRHLRARQEDRRDDLHDRRRGRD